MRRRTVLKTLAVSTGVLAQSPKLFAQSSSPTKIGISLTLSGPVSAIGNNLLHGIELYRDTHSDALNGLPEVKFLIRDDKGSPDEARRIAQDFIVKDKVSLICGGSLSPQAFAIAPLVSKAKVPFLNINASTADITRRSDFIVRISYTNWQGGFMLGTWAAANGHRSAKLLVSDYSAGQDSGKAFAAAFKAAGGSVLETIAAPMDTTDYMPYMTRIQTSSCDCVYMFVNAGHVMSAVEAFKTSGLKASGVQLFGPCDIVMDDDVARGGAVYDGLTAGDIYSATNPIPQNLEFVRLWKSKFGNSALPNFEAVFGWDAMAAVYELLKAKNGKLDNHGSLAFLSNWSYDSPRGHIEVDPATRDIIQPVYIERIKAKGEVMVKDVLKTYPAVKDQWKVLKA